MRQFISAAAALLVVGALAQQEEKRDLCSNGSTDDHGNWYCQEVTAITYTGVGGHSSYNKITNMDSSSGACSSKPFGFSGSMSPLDEEVSLHFRGPIKIKQFAVYTPGSSSTKKARRANSARHAHAHGHAHGHAEKREAAVGDTVTATIDGVVVSWANEYSGQAKPAADSASSSTPAAAPASPGTPVIAKAKDVVSAAVSGLTGSSSSGTWSRNAYYHAASQTSQGLVFLNYNGGSGSGTFDYTFGNSLSYASTDGCSGASSPQILADTTIPSVEEVIIMSDADCSDGACGYSRPGTVAHHGFGGSQKLFLVEFGMPDDGKTASSIYNPVNMPALWILNAQIPRTLQYGAADCSCWTSGCGEFDVFEVLAPGDKRCKSTLHGNVNGGDSDYFKRPVDGTIKAAILFQENNIHIQVLDDSYVFGSSIDQATIDEMCSSTLTQSEMVSLFKLASS